jgi:hypothetical protein
MLTEGARKIYHGRHGARGRRVGQGWSRQNVGASTSYSPMGLHGLLQGYIYVLLYNTEW